jgi:Repeat of unknown function (DUF5648)
MKTCRKPMSGPRSTAAKSWWAALLCVLCAESASAAGPGSTEAANCMLALSNTAYEVWPGVPALKVGRFSRVASGNQQLTVHAASHAALCNSNEWAVAGGVLPYGFRAADRAFAHSVPVRRFRHRGMSSYLYTSDPAEIAALQTTLSGTWVDEGVVFHAPDGTVHQRTQYEPYIRSTRYLSNYPLVLLDADATAVGKKAMWAPAPGTGLVPVMRFFHAVRGHAYASGAADAVAMGVQGANSGYRYEGIAFWAFAPAPLRGMPDLPEELTGTPYEYKPLLKPYAPKVGTPP